MYAISLECVSISIYTHTNTSTKPPCIALYFVRLHFGSVCCTAISIWLYMSLKMNYELLTNKFQNVCVLCVIWCGCVFQQQWIFCVQNNKAIQSGKMDALCRHMYIVHTRAFSRHSNIECATKQTEEKPLGKLNINKFLGCINTDTAALALHALSVAKRGSTRIRKLGGTCKINISMGIYLSLNYNCVIKIRLQQTVESKQHQNGVFPLGFGWCEMYTAIHIASFDSIAYIANMYNEQRTTYIRCVFKILVSSNIFLTPRTDFQKQKSNLRGWGWCISPHSAVAQMKPKMHANKRARRQHKWMAETKSVCDSQFISLRLIFMAVWKYYCCRDDIYCAHQMVFFTWFPYKMAARFFSYTFLFLILFGVHWSAADFFFACHWQCEILTFAVGIN